MDAAKRFEKTEGLIYRHFQNIKERDKLDHKRQLIRDQIREIKSDIHDKSGIADLIFEKIRISQRIRELDQAIGKTDYAIRALDEDCRQIVAYRFGGGFKFQQIADIFNVSETAVRRKRDSIIQSVAGMIV